MRDCRLYRYFSGTAFAVALLLATSCRPSYEVAKVEGKLLPVDSTWDAVPQPEALALLAPYKTHVDSIMQEVIGTSAMPMDRYRPESPLSNLVADVLRESATQALGRPADMGLVNIGGIRNVLPQGPLTTAHIYEILPFENSLCVLTLDGATLHELLENIAARGGEGVSGVRLEISGDGKLLRATIGGKPVDEARTYTVATLDYLAEGNDGMRALPKASDRQCPPGATLRGLFMDYVKRQAAEGRPLRAQVEGRIVMRK